MGYRVKVQKVERPTNRSFYVNLPVALAESMGVRKGETYEWQERARWQRGAEEGRRRVEHVYDSAASGSLRESRRRADDRSRASPTTGASLLRQSLHRHVARRAAVLAASRCP